MEDRLRTLLALASLTLLSACSGSNGEPADNLGGGSGVTSGSPIQADVSQQVGMSKYSPRQSYYHGGSSKADWIRNPTKDLPNQSLYTASNSRSHLIDHFISNEPPQFIPLTNWKYDFIAGELALDAQDVPEAKKMFELSLAAAAKEKEPIASQHKALSKARLALVARMSEDYERAEALFKESLSSLEASAEEENIERAAIISLYELAWISANKGDLESSAQWLKKRVSLREKYHGHFSPATAPLLNDFANVLFYQRKFAEAEFPYTTALLIATRFTKDSDHRSMANYNLANCFFAESKFADALPLYEKANDSRKATVQRMEECRSKISALPDAEKKARKLPITIGDPGVWIQLLESAEKQANYGKNWEAQKTLEAALDEARASERKSSELPATELRLGNLLFQQQNLDQARRLYESAWESLKSDPKSSFQAAEALSGIMLCQLLRNEHAAAKNSLALLKQRGSGVDWYRLVRQLEQCNEKRMFSIDNDPESKAVLKAVCEECLIQLPKKDSMPRAVAMANLARSIGREDDDKCCEFLKQALAIAERTQKSEPKNKQPELVYRLQMNAGTYLMAAQQYKDAEACFKSALAYSELHPGKENRQLLNTIEMSRALYSNWKKADEEEALLKRKMELTNTDVRTPETVASDRRSELLELARIARSRGDLLKAAEYLEDAIKIERRDPNNAPPEARDLITIYTQTGQWSKAQSWHETIAKMLPAQSGQQFDQEMYNAAVFAAKSGTYDTASKLIQAVISDMEGRNETRVRDFGCYESTPSYPAAVRLLGNCTMDGQSNYDKAFSIYSKEIKSLQPTDTEHPIGTGRPLEPGEPSDNRLESRPKVDASRPQSQPGRRSLNQLGGASQPLRLTSEQLTNFVICCDAIGNKNVADEHRAQLKSRLDEALSRQLRGENGARNPYYDQAIQLLHKEKRSKDEEIALMGLVTRTLNSPKIYSGSMDGAELLDRVIAWKIQKGGSSKSDLSKDYDSMIALLMCNRRFNEALPYSARKVDLLKELGSSKVQVADAVIESAKLDQEQGSFALAEKKYLQNLPVVKGEKKKYFEALKNLAYCLQMQESYSEAIKYLKEAVALAESPAEKNDMHVRLGTLFDITNNPSQASSEFKLVVPDTKDSYSVYEPLRNASDYQAQLKHFQIADTLYRRQASLLGTAPSSALGISNAYSQMARMYKYARKFDKAKQAYELAITALKTNPSDSFCKSQVQSMQKEVAEMK